MNLMLQIGIWGYNYNFSDLLRDLDQFGFFRLVLPFLLLFGVTYAILTKIEIFKENRGAGVVVSLAAALLALQWDVVPAFFQTIFPNLGIAISIILVALILAGAFISDTDNKKAFSWIFFGLGALIFLIVIFSSFSSWQFVGTGWWQQYGALIVMGIIVIGAFVGIIVASKES